jgi:hypothetical protein
VKFILTLKRQDMREIKFRGKTYADKFYPDLSPSKWVYGFITQFPKDFAWMHIGPNDNQVIVNPDTVGQFTGLYDKNGVEIFFGDIVCNKFGDVGKVVWFSDCSIRVDWGGGDIHFIDPEFGLEVIGNIFDNSDLLNTKSE